ncbi:MAG: phage terminase large subunit [Treponemataceae bacterium]|nr:MAG: phage terminase large subunit [Treponemataceae bacterium]
MTDEVKKELDKLRKYAAVKHLPFMDWTWQNHFEPYVIGRHTRIICDIIDKAILRWSKGESVYVIVSCPPRHGKSQIISRSLPAHFFGLFPDSKVILSGHTGSLTEGFSRESRELIKTAEYKELFGDIEIDEKLAQASHWKIANHQGECFSAGLTGGLTGQGGDLLILDDYCSTREDAESATMRNKAWDAFTNNFMTRRAPHSIVIVLATRWHTDDIIGRIKKCMEDDPTYPRFDEVNLPAFSADYPTGTLFPERFPLEYYESQRALLGEYSFSALMQGEPVVRGGNRFRVDRICENTLEEFPKTQYWRIFDLAHTKKERDKQDPDYTVGTLLALVQDAEKSWHCWVKDIWRVQEDAPERDAGILRLHEKDDTSVKYGIEHSNDSKDAYKTLRKVLDGKRLVVTGRAVGDKSVRASPLEPIVEAGHFHILKGAVWAHDFIAEFAAFPSSTHDDQVDTVSAGYDFIVSKPVGFYSDPKTQEFIKQQEEKRMLALKKKRWIEQGIPYETEIIPDFSVSTN